MRQIYLAITGLGNVGRRLLELIESKRETLTRHLNLEIIVSGVCDSSGAIIHSNGLDIHQILEAKKQNQGISTLSGATPGIAPPEFVNAMDADMLVELTLTNLKNGEPGLSAIQNALQKSMHVVTANKGPLVVAYPRLAELAKSHGAKLLHSAAVTGGLPTLNIGSRDLCAASIERVEGILNGTTNYILTKMSEGESYADALKYAQKVGMAEADPSLDVDGWDAACKLVIIANAVLRRPTTLKDVSVEGISDVTLQQLQQVSSRNQVMKLVALA